MIPFYKVQRYAKLVVAVIRTVVAYGLWELTESDKRIWGNYENTHVFTEVLITLMYTFYQNLSNYMFKKLVVYLNLKNL